MKSSQRKTWYTCNQCDDKDNTKRSIKKHNNGVQYPCHPCDYESQHGRKLKKHGGSLCYACIFNHPLSKANVYR